MVEIKSYSKLKSNNGTDSASGIGGGSGYINTTIATKLKQIHSLWGNQFDGTQDVQGPISAPSVDVSTNLSVHGDSVFDETATFGEQTKFKKNVSINGTLDVSAGASFGDQTKFKKDVSINGTLDVRSDANFNSQSTFKGTTTFNSNANTTNVLPLKNKEYNLGDDNHQWKNIVGENLLVNNLKVTGQAHFFELIIDKVKSAGGSMLLTPADSFVVDKVIELSTGYRILWKCQDGNGKQRDNMWKVNDQALCMSFNQAAVETSHNVNNKYYWALVMGINKTDSPIEIDGEMYNYIYLSKFNYDGTLNPEVGDTIVMCGYRGTDDKTRQSAIYMSAYSSLDKGLTAPVFAQYQGINDFNLESHRKSYYDANSAKFIGEFEATDGQNIIDIIDGKIKDSEAAIKLNTKNIVLSVSEKTKERRNLLIGSDFKRENNNFIISNDARIEMNRGFQGTNCIDIQDKTEAGNLHYVGVYWDGSQGGRSIKIEKGKKYTISCYYKTNDINAKFYLEAIYTDKQTNAERKGQVTYLSPNDFSPKYNEWQLFTTVIDTTDAKTDYIAVNFWEGCNVNAGYIEAWICRPMIEEGPEYNGWTLSKEDYDYIGANLLDNTRTFDEGGTIMLSRGNKKLVDDVYELSSTSSDDFNTFYQINNTAFKLNTDYTMSFELKGTAKYLGVYSYYPATNTPCTLYIEVQNNIMQEQYSDGKKDYYGVFIKETCLAKQHKVWIHFKFKDRLPNYIYFMATADKEQSGVTSWTVSITKPKIEEGANVTQWTEKKTDVENAINTIKTNTSKLEQKANSIESKVTSNTTNINNITGQLSSQSTSISKLEQKADSITSTVSNMTKSNGTNLFSFTNTNFKNYWCRSAIQMNVFFTLKLNQGIYRLQNFGTNGEGGDFVVSFDARVLKDTTVNVNFCDIGAEENHGDIALTTAFQHYVLHFKNIQSDFLNKGLYNGFIDFEPKTTDETNQLYVANFMLERGTIPSEKFSISEADKNNYGNDNSFKDWEAYPTVTNVYETINGKMVQAYKLEGVPSGVTYVDILKKENLQNSMKIDPDKVYTLSFWAKTSEGGHGIYCFLWPDINDEGIQSIIYKGLNGGGAQEQYSAKTDGSTLCELDTTWRKFYVHWHPHTVGDIVNCNVGRLYANMTVWLSDVKLEEGYICDENLSNQETYSSIKQTAESILMNVKNTYVKIGDGNITLNGNTNIQGSLTLTNKDQGFMLLDKDGTTEISPKSIGTYEEFKTKTTNIIKTRQEGIQTSGFSTVSQQEKNGKWKTYTGFCWYVNQKYGTLSKGSYIKISDYFYNLWGINGKGTNDSILLSGISEYADLDDTIFEIWEGDGIKHDYGNGEVVYEPNATFKLKTLNNYTYTVVGDNVDVHVEARYVARVDITYWKETDRSNWKIYFDTGWTNEIPKTSKSYMLIGYDGYAINFGTNKTVLCGKEGFIANFGDTILKINSDGITTQNIKPKIVEIYDSPIFNGMVGDGPNPDTVLTEFPDYIYTEIKHKTKIKFTCIPKEGQKFRIYTLIDEPFQGASSDYKMPSVEFSDGYVVKNKTHLTSGGVYYGGIYDSAKPKGRPYIISEFICLAGKWFYTYDY